jgi:NADH-quinone oxidoreductase subunit G
MREGVMEFLLINHPLDCPICDQAGECDLQDQSLFYGKGTSRFKENKRAVKDKDIGPLIKTYMTRCIHCTRCVRFLEDIAGTYELGAVNRGEDMEISTYIDKSITSELSGNIIDLCPVGALTSRPYAFKARSWELSKTESIDVLDAVGSNIRIDSRGREVMRVLPRLNEDINEEWISDKTRFAYDGLKYQRLDIPMIKERGRLMESTWEVAYSTIKKVLDKADKTKVGAIAGDLTDVETMLCTKELLMAIGSNNYDCRQDGSLLDNSDRAMYIFNTTIAGIDETDFCLIIGSNPRHEAAILNARLRRAQLNNNAKIVLIGKKIDLNYSYKHLGENPWLLKQIASGEHPFCESLNGFKKPMLIIGSGAMARGDYEATLYYAKKLALRYGFVTEQWNGFNILQRSASRVGGLDIGFIPGKDGKNTNEMLKSDMQVLLLLGADEIDAGQIDPGTFVVYVGHHGDRLAYRADVILPSAAFTEKNATFVNLEGRVQSSVLAVYPPDEAKEDWVIINELAKYLGINLGYTTIDGVRKRMVKINPVFAELGCVRREKFHNELGKMQDFQDDAFICPIDNFYRTDPISRASKSMAECTRVINTKNFL